jgi:hypothetical protein
MTRNTELRAVSALSVCRRQIARHHGQAFAIAIPVALAILTTSILGPLLLLVAAEALLVGILPFVPSFQRRVNEELAREARAAKLAERARLMPAIAAGHRSELEELEAIAGAIRFRTGCAVDRDDWLGMDGLLTLYLRLALAHRKSTDAAFSCAGSVNLDRQVTNVAYARSTASAAARPRIEQHLAILERRRELKASMEERRSVIACDLASIADLVRCLHEECVAADGASASSEVPEAIMEGLRGGVALSELALLRASFTDDLDAVPPLPPLALPGASASAPLRDVRDALLHAAVPSVHA